MRENFLQRLKENEHLTTTENGAIAYDSTLNACLDAFGAMGAMKNSDEDQIINVFKNAFLEDRELAMRLLFYIRDIRGGQGMRRVFRVCIKWLADHYSEYVTSNLDNILYFGRGDDYLCLLDTSIKDEVLYEMKRTLMFDMAQMNIDGEVSLLAKWMPSENASSKETRALARKIIEGFGWTPSRYRKTLSTLRKYLNVVEVKMSSNSWNKISYEAVPAKAAMNYSEAFERHDPNRYVNYLEKIANGEAKINAKSLFPVDIIHNIMGKWNYSLREKIVYDAMWKSLPNYFEGREEIGICMVDTSGSMCGTPMEVAISLGLYCADKCHGPFKGHYITFSEHPHLVEVKGENICEKVRNMPAINPLNTNIEAAFDLILQTAIVNHSPQSDLPSKLYIISDMQFDMARGATTIWGRSSLSAKPFMQKMKEKYACAGYVLPSIVYWNVRASKCGMFQQTFEGEDCAMVSGYSASLFKSIIDGTEFEEEEITSESGEVVRIKREKIDPINVMISTLMNERYDRVVTKPLKFDTF